MSSQPLDQMMEHLIYHHTKNNRFELANSFIKIFHKIIKYPNEPKYKDLNYSAIYYKFDKCSFCIGVFKKCGFYISNDEKRLIFDAKQLPILKKHKESMSLTLSTLMNAVHDIEIPLKYLSYHNKYVKFIFIVSL